MSSEVSALRKNKKERTVNKQGIRGKDRINTLDLANLKINYLCTVKSNSARGKINDQFSAAL